ncbi:hypothetical protein COCNU_08G000540 [Cocos nucifera]|uniref:Uncharacterized protein n=1 Tax=Cocos nucifera TaxID=13894 RepID=A0A8K0IGH6_COCNU|nr:hypothetical protein COCNU_08G000540 [Cocos nucifera]
MPVVTTVAILEVAGSTKIIPAIEVGVADKGSMPPTSSSPPDEDQASQPPTEKDKEGDKKGKKKFVIKVPYKARPGGSSSDNNNLEEDLINNSKIVWELINKLVVPKVVNQMAGLNHVQLIQESLRTFLKSGHQIPMHIRMVHRLKVEALKTQEDHQAEADHL